MPIRAPYTPAALALAALLALVPSTLAQQSVAEQSSYQRTGANADVTAFLGELAENSERVTLTSIGDSHEGNPLHLAILADPPIGTPEQASDSGKLVVLLFGNIHAGEVCGKEALQMLCRDLAMAEDAPLLNDLIVCFVPNYNPDGNDRFDPDNRPGQNGPERMGTRANAQGLDLNRDHLKMQAPETLALNRFLTEWDPAVIVDTHTTNGSLHQYALTYQGPKHPATDQEVLSYVRDTMLPAIDEAFEETTGRDTFFYGNFRDRQTKWATYPAEPRYGVAYRGMRNRLSILSEAYAYDTFEGRVKSTYAFCEQVLNYAAEHASEIRDLVKAADRRTIEAGGDPDGTARVPLRIDVRAFEEKVEILGYEVLEAEDGRRIAGDPGAYEVEFVNDFVSTEDVALPYAYVFDPRMEDLAQFLQRHGVEVEVLREQIELDIERYELSDIQRAERPYAGMDRISSLIATPRTETMPLSQGTYVVRTAQKLGTLAAYMLEPRAFDGLLAWGMLDEWLTSDHPIGRLARRQPMLLREARPLPEDSGEPRHLTFDDVYGDNRVDFDGSLIRSTIWIDGDTWYQRKDDELRIVNAWTGRSEPAGIDEDTIADRLAELPTVTNEEAESIADRFPLPIPDVDRVVFTHAGDLYTAAPDGSEAVRLTSTPAREELAELSPDGQFVSFIRDNNLYVVDIATKTERQLTTGGADELRHGKNSWVYFEEIYGRRWKAYWWSPDSTHIAYLIQDSSDVPTFTIVDDKEEPQRIEVTRYPKPGQPNPIAQLAVVRAAGGTPVVAEMNDYDPAGSLITWVGWTTSGELRMAIQDRIQTWMDLRSVDIRSGNTEKYFRETTEAWVNPIGQAERGPLNGRTYNGGMVELSDASFLLFSERDGWQHLYHYSPDAALLSRLTEGEYEVRTVHYVDEEEGFVYFTGTADSSLEVHFYRVPLPTKDNPGPNDPFRLTPESGTHSIQMSPDGELFIDRYSSFDQTPRANLRDKNGELVRTIDTNPVYELEQFIWPELEHVVIADTADNHELEAMVIYPPGFDETAQYPVWFFTYAGPHAPTVRDTWAGGRMLERLAATHNIIAFRGDPYSASGKGAISEQHAYKRLGEPEFDDIETMIRWINDKPWADSTRVGMSGHSYGGYMTLYMLTRSDLFSAGISGAPVTSWRDYDTIYTERYMQTPQTNPDGYARTNLVDTAEGLTGELLLMHGTMDDNVHMQNSIKMIHALRLAEKQFDFFTYPGARHGFPNMHYRRLVWDHMLGTMNPDLPEGPEGEN
ncbi:MAG: DPP IV N-terminal domain-containing protein [Planctomycetota bacterium]